MAETSGNDPLAYLGAPDATQQVKGIIEIATLAETVAGLRDDVATTPAGVAAIAIAGAPLASTSTPGIIEIATDGEAVAGSANDLAVVPSNLGAVFASPPPIGSGTPNSGIFTTLTATDFVLTNPLSVPEGGTGLATITDHGVMLGSGTGAVTPTAVGATNQIFIGQTGADPIWSDNIDVQGTLDVTGVATFDDTVTFDGAVVINAGLTIDSLIVDDITIDSNAISSSSSLDIDAAGALSVNSSAGVINVGNDAVAQAINIGTGAAARVITIGNVTGATQVVLNSGTAGVSIASTGAGDILINSDDTLLLDADGVLELNSSGGVIGIGNDADAQDINIGTGAAARVITIGNVTGASQVVINSGTAGVSIASTGAGDIVIDSDDTVLIDSDGVLELNSSAGDISIGNDAVAQTLNLNTGAAAKVTNVGSSNTTSSTVISAGSGNLTAASGGTILADAAGNIEVNSSAGNILVGNDAVAQTVSINTGAAAKVTNIGSTNTTSSTVINAGSGLITMAGLVALNSAAGPQLLAGAGDPDTAVTAPQGSMFLRTDGSSTSTRMYINTDGSTAWTNVVTAT